MFACTSFISQLVAADQVITTQSVIFITFIFIVQIEVPPDPETLGGMARCRDYSFLAKKNVHVLNHMTAHMTC